MRIVFCGDTFPEAAEYLCRALPEGFWHEVIVWQGKSLQNEPRDVDVLIPKMYRVDGSLMDATRARLIQQWGAGLEGVDLEAAKARGIAVANLPASGSNADSVAEHAILLTLALLRKLPLAQTNVYRGILGAPTGRMLAGRTVTLYGLGAIALPIVERLRAFNVRLFGITRDPHATKVQRLGLDRCFSIRDKAVCLQETDVLILCLRLSEETRDAIGEYELSLLPKGALLVNVARGGVVNYGALLAALESGRLGGVGLDVFWKEPFDSHDPILHYENVIATPHIAGITSQSLSEIAMGVANNIHRLRNGARILNRVV
jgi:phosphoglycerate dehydrogenase-like enzyme